LRLTKLAPCDSVYTAYLGKNIRIKIPKLLTELVFALVTWNAHVIDCGIISYIIRATRNKIAEEYRALRT
jgi:hypothetical protein